MRGVIAEEMRQAARRLREALTDEQADAAFHPFADADRTRWDYRPRPRPGACIGEFGLTGRKRAHQLLATAMSPHAFAQITTIMGLEEVLDRAESWRRGRHSDDFWIAVFGSPEDEAWAWRFEGHHVSVSMTVVAEEVSPTPVFLGANPASVDYRGAPVVRPLAIEEELARDLLARLPDRQRAQAIVSPVAPSDIRTGNARDISDIDRWPGLRAADLSRGNAEILDRLIDVYLDRLPPSLAAAERAVIEPDAIHFAWEGSAERGGGHYYRLQSPRLLIEYDNTQNDANHVHTVLRRPGDDFGRGLLPSHVASEREPR